MTARKPRPKVPDGPRRPGVAPGNALELQPGDEWELSPRPPFSFELTTHKPRYGFWATPFEVYAPGLLWSGFWAVSGEPVGVRLEDLGSVDRPRVHAVVFSRRETVPPDHREVQDHLGWLLGVDEDLAPFYELCRRQPVLDQARRDLYGMRDTPFADHVTGLVVAVTLQMTSWKRSQEMMRAVFQEFGAGLAFDGRSVVLAPPASRLAATPVDELRARARLGYRAGFLARAAERIAAGFPGPRELSRLDPREATRLLLELPGVGRYSADIMTPHPSFPVDSWSAPIFARLLGLKLNGRPEPDLKRVRQAAEQAYGPWRSYVYAYVLHDWERLAAALS